MSLLFPDRRLVLAGLAASTLSVAPAFAQKRPKVAALFAGRIDDAGFMQAGYSGLTEAQKQFGVEVAFKQGVAPKSDELAAALRELAAAGPDLVVAHGGQNNAAAQKVAAEFPKIPFVVTQGNVTGANLASYEVLQEQSAFLAGMLAGLTTKSGVVGHMSGIRVVPGLKGRAGYAHGVAHANPKAKLLTNFSGNQDDNALSERVAKAMIAAGADIIFTMLNAGRQGAIDACRAGGAKQIGNVGDWTKTVPDVFVASAVADSGRAFFAAVSEFTQGKLATGHVRHIGLEDPAAIRLTLAPSVPADIRAKLDTAANEIKAGKLVVPVEWTGTEFATPA